MRFKLFPFVVAAGVCAVSCAPSGNGQQQPNQTIEAPDDCFITPGVTADSSDSLNSIPLFTDDGQLEAMYRSKGILFGPDIVKEVRNGNRDAQFVLAQMYTYGICGAKPNRQKAFKLYVALADENNAAAKAMAGYQMFYGLGTSEDTEQGLQMIADAANQDNWLAFFMLGNIYYHNMQPTAENVKYAKVCFAKAAANGIEAAQIMLDQIK